MNYSVKVGVTSLIPVADGVFETNKMTSESALTGTFVIAFFDSDGVTPITPSAGTVKPEGVPIEGTLSEPGSGDVLINANDVKARSDGPITYEIPVFNGPMTKGVVTLSGVTGASFFKAEFNRW